jgi:LysR family transcriptional regulator, regulator for metE and metH
MDIEIKHLQLVLAIAEHQTLTKAGTYLHLTQSALSHQLREIESRLGAELFVRANRRMSPTAAGERLLETARLVLPAIKSAEDAIRSGPAPQGLTLRISTECYTCYHWLPGILTGLKETVPTLDLVVDIASTLRPVQALFEEKLDVAIMSSPVRDRRLTAVPLFEDELVVVVAPDHRFARREFVELADFERETLLIYGPREDSTILNRDFVAAGVMPAAVKEAHLTEAIIEMARAGLGVGVLARWAVQPHVAAGAVVAVRLTRGGYRRVWNAVSLRRQATTRQVKEFVRLAKNWTPGAVPVPARIVTFTPAGTRARRR